MQAYNLSHDTLLPSKAAAERMGVEYSESPNGVLFVKKEQHMGILPTILTELLAARKRAKAQMKTAANEFDAAVYVSRVPIFHSISARFNYASQVYLRFSIYFS